MAADVTDQMVQDYARDGAVLVRGLFAPWVEQLRAGIEKNMAAPTQQMPTLKPGEQGRFFDDYCNWDKIAEFRDTIFAPEVAQAAARLMQSPRVQLFHDHET